MRSDGQFKKGGIPWNQGLKGGTPWNLGLRKDPITRFERFYIPEPNSGCWLWLGAVDKDGYGFFWLDGKTIRASQASWILFNGRRIGRKFALHSCDNPSCVNPQHLFLGNNKNNMIDCSLKGRIACGERHGNATLTDKQAKEIEGLYEWRVCGYQRLAEMFGVGRTTVARIIKKQGRFYATTNRA